MDSHNFPALHTHAEIQMSCRRNDLNAAQEYMTLAVSAIIHLERTPHMVEKLSQDALGHVVWNVANTENIGDQLRVVLVRCWVDGRGCRRVRFCWHQVPWAQAVRKSQGIWMHLLHISTGFNSAQ